MWSDQIRLTLVGVSHHTAALDVRERFVCDAAAETGVQDVLSRAGMPTVLLSTCNRTELYVATEASHDPAEACVAVLSEHADMTPAMAARWLYCQRDEAVVHHLFRVAAGLDSLVVGESQIQGQVRAAQERAMVRAAQRSAPTMVLGRLFDAALLVGGRVRTQTQLGAGAASVPSAAVALARQLFGSLQGRRALVLGTGDMSGLALRCLTAEGMLGRVVSTRSPARAEGLAALHGGAAAPLSALSDLLAETDVLLTATDGGGDIVGRAVVERARARAAGAPLLIVDIAVPREVAPEVGELPGVFLHHLDDLRAVVAGTLDQRRAAIDAAEQIVRRGAVEYWDWHLGRRAVPVIRELRGRAEQVRQRELEKTLRSLQHLSSADHAAIDALTKQLLAKVLHPPTARLREAAATGGDAELVELVRYLFALDDDYDQLHEPRRGADRRMLDADEQGAHG